MIISFHQTQCRKCALTNFFLLPFATCRPEGDDPSFYSTQGWLICGQLDWKESLLEKCSRRPEGLRGLPLPGWESTQGPRQELPSDHSFTC